MNALVRYEEMRIAVEQCARIDEAADIRDKAAALSAYARQRDDAELAVWTQEIKLRASVRIGELVRELDTAHKAGQGEGEVQLPSGGKLKEQAIEEAGLSKSEAYRYQELAGPKDEQAHKAASAAAERYFAQSRANMKPATMDGLRGAVREAVHATIGAPPPRRQVEKAPEASIPAVGAAWIDWFSAVKHLAEARLDFDLAVPGFSAERRMCLKEAQIAASKLSDWIEALEARSDQDAA